MPFLDSLDATLQLSLFQAISGDQDLLPFKRQLRQLGQETAWYLNFDVNLRLLLEGRRATGVSIHRHGQTETIFSEREVIRLWITSNPDALRHRAQETVGEAWYPWPDRQVPSAAWRRLHQELESPPRPRHRRSRYSPTRCLSPSL